MLKNDLENKKYLVLVDENDKELGVEEKIKAHKDCKLHRAFSVLIFNKLGQVLLQRRNLEKYHSGGLWSNTCCSHPYPNEDTLVAAHRRLKEELGFDTELKFIKKVHYKTDLLENDLYENEVVSIFIGVIDSYTSSFDKEEIAEVEWMDLDEFLKELNTNPKKYTFWIKEYIKTIDFKKELKNF